jgi:DNA-binding FadR family transcriptional regulator
VLNYQVASRARKAVGAAAAEEGAKRTLAADPVFDALAGAILRGKFTPGGPLPPERELAALFNVSRLIVRQALHRLREIGLVRGGQGGQSIVLDPETSNDPRIVALTMQLAPERAHEQDVMERQILAGAMLLHLAELRVDDAGIAALQRIVDDASQKDAGTPPVTEAEMGGVETEFWTTLAALAQNRILLREARWWFDLMKDQPERRRRMYGRPELRLALYQAVMDRLRKRERVAEFYLDAVRTLLARGGADAVARGAGDET